MKSYLAIDIGGTQLRAAVFPSEGITPLRQKRIPTRGPGTPLERLVGLVRELEREDEQVVSISTGVPGMVDPRSGILFRVPNIPEWDGVALRDELQQRFNVPVFVGNDANLAALGEWLFGAGRGHHNMLYLTISTGVGSGVIIDDRLLLGWKGIGAELGHVSILPGGPMCSCGQRGHIEAIASGRGIANYVAEQLVLGRTSTLSGVPSAREISAAALAGDALAVEAFERAATFLGIMVASYLHIFNPSILVLGGGVSQSRELFMAPFRAALEQHIIAREFIDGLQIVPAALGDDCGLLGALALARDYQAS